MCGDGHGFMAESGAEGVRMEESVYVVLYSYVQ